MTKQPPVAPPPTPPGWGDEIEARVERIGRWTYRVQIHHGVMVYGPSYAGEPGAWHVLGAERARRKASRELLRYLRKLGRNVPVEIYRVGERADGHA